MNRFCPECGAEQIADAPAGSDPLIGTTVADRYTIAELLGAGGMAKVYRARQRLLDRDVALKLIHPELVVSEESVPRFIAEARAASRLNHPNVVSIFDFGVASAASKQFYLVMELLQGRDLATLLEAEGSPTFARTANILQQVLAALHEAHEQGITHRDIKPENIFVEAGRRGEDRVKVIDFGIAKARAPETASPRVRRITQQGQLVGTPYFMAPEQLEGASGPSVDLYAVAVCLFLMITGRVPFDAESITEILQMHAEAPRPDPRVVAPHRAIPSRLAEVCMRALDVDPARRYPSAHALAEAITSAVSSDDWAKNEASLFPSKSSRPSTGARSASLPSTEPPALRPASASPLVNAGRLLPGRVADLAWGEALLGVAQGVRAVVYYGSQGGGRTRLADELAETMHRKGAYVLHVPAHVPPASEIGYAWLRRAVTALAGPELAKGRTPPLPDAKKTEVADGLAAIFGSAPAGMQTTTLRKTVRAALEWAAIEAVKTGARPDAPVVLVIDDADCLDGVSQLALSDFLFSTARFPGLLRVLMTCEACPDTSLFDGMHARELSPLSEEDVATLLAAAGAAPAEGPKNPLYLDQVRRFRAEGQGDDPPRTLQGIVEWRERVVPVARRRVLQALAVLGPAPAERLLKVLARPEDLDEAWGPLEAAGFVCERDGLRMLAHRVFGQVARDVAPSGALAELCARAADALDTEPDARELRAACALVGRPDFEAFFLVEETARLRASRGDDDGAIASLYEGLRVARLELATGDAETATSAVVVFSRKLGEMLVNVGRTDEAYGVLSEALDLSAPTSLARALVLEQLSRALEQRGRHTDATELRRQATALAEQRGDSTLAARLKSPEARPSTGVRQRSWMRSPSQWHLAARAKSGDAS